jgi:hypothetical protein
VKVHACAQEYAAGACCAPVRVGDGQGNVVEGGGARARALAADTAATRRRRANLGFEMFGRAHAPQISLRLTPFPLFAALVHWSGALSVAEAQRKAGTG